MAELKLTPRQQVFVNAIIAGKTQAEAYKLAGYRGTPKKREGRKRATLDQAASSVMRSSRVQETLAHARTAQAERAAITVQDLVDRLERAYDVALSCDPPQANAAVSATMGIGKLLGLVLDRSELTVIRDKPSPVATKILELSEEDWKKTFAQKK